ncbi:AraC family transcriptional regulator [Streptomyces qinglanensis]|uniref:AraC family transcriptional regulator n=1 Tax=Streptomyces qinglanensis TaxID=943816 RepID=A0A1E7K3Y4_9ACTN|nr:AraC family transcriptional regulator [Streptomyces qinglanensis]OEU98556.1 AraC family transcriptional regulator [Streptomyces qinglanensis]OEV26784.1 AraC family transcriptional regulator [Streptomyces nanshensis]
MDVVSDAISAVHLGHPWSHRLRTSGNWCAQLDRYDGAGFYVVLKGHCWLLTDSSAPTPLGVGDAVLLPHGTGHVIADFPVDAGVAKKKAVPFEQSLVETEHRTRTARHETDILCGKYWLDCSRMHPLMAELPEVVHLPSRVGDHLELRAAIELLAGELDEIRPGSCVALPSLLDLLLVYMIRAWMTETTSGAWPRVLGDPVTAAALRALHSDPAAPWSNDLLAAEAGVSRHTLARRFTNLVGRPPMAYLAWWRVIRAAALLRDTRDTLATIAGRVGYGSPYALSHAFQREFGTTPGRYRTQTVGRSADVEAD